MAWEGYFKMEVNSIEKINLAAHQTAVTECSTSVQRSDEKLNQIISAVSHNFKTPLATIKLSTSYLLKYWTRLEPAAIEEKLATILEQTNNLVYSVDSIVAQRTAAENKIEASKKTVDLLSFFERLVKSLKEKFPHHTIEFTNKVRIQEIEADEDLLQNIFSNLIGNALLYSPHNFTIWLNITESEKSIIIEVKDCGLGISENDLPKIFNSFYRGSNAEGIKGMGLGLSIARRAAEAMNAKIEVRSKPGEGSTFTITIPKI